MDKQRKLCQKKMSGIAGKSLFLWILFSIIYFTLTFYIPIGIILTETHIRDIKKSTKFVKIAKKCKPESAHTTQT